MKVNRLAKLSIFRLRFILDILISPLIFIASILFLFIRRAGVYNFPISKNVLLKIGVFPVRNHYYEPQFVYSQYGAKERHLPGIDLNVNEQLDLLNEMIFSRELLEISVKETSDYSFYFNNGNFESGDAEFLYQMIRLKKPKRIYEIGSGYSTRMAIRAIKKNMIEDSKYVCSHICIEPYEMSWLEKSGVEVKRSKVEDIDVNFFSSLDKNDILFIDSSHIIRPEGDVLYEYLELLPTLRKGVLVHIHDIFTPQNYPKEFLVDRFLFWNEQYFLESFLSNNNSYKIVGALNYLHHEYFDELSKVAPFLKKEREPGSFWIQKV